MFDMDSIKRFVINFPPISSLKAACFIGFYSKNGTAVVNENPELITRWQGLYFRSYFYEFIIFYKTMLSLVTIAIASNPKSSKIIYAYLSVTISGAKG